MPSKIFRCSSLAPSLLRLWNVTGPGDFRGADELLVPGQQYSMDLLPFGLDPEEPFKAILYLEGVNSSGPVAAPQPVLVSVRVVGLHQSLSDRVRVTVVEAGIGVNNSNAGSTETMRPGVPDVEFSIDEFDEIVEDQGAGFVAWMTTDRSPEVVDLLPILVTVPEVLNTSDLRVAIRYRRQSGGDSSLSVCLNPSQAQSSISYISNEAEADRLLAGCRSTWTLLPDSDPSGQVPAGSDPTGTGSVQSRFVFRPVWLKDILYSTETSKNTLELVLSGPDGTTQQVLDSAVLTVKPLFWEGGIFDGSPRNNVFWMGTTRDAPFASFLYRSDTVAGGVAIERSIQAHQSVEQWLSQDGTGVQPDLTKSKYLIYLHGFNVNPDQAFEEFSNVFRRTYWAGFRGNFIGITWAGDEDDPLGHVCPDFGFPLPPGSLIPTICVANFFTNMESAFRTSPALKEFLEDRVRGDWNAQSGDVFLVAHSLGNLVALDALRLHSVASDDRLVENMVAVEAAVWEETFWPEAPVLYGSSGMMSVDRLERASWAFWFNQADHPVSASVARLVNTYSSSDEALLAMKFNDLLYRVKGPRLEHPQTHETIVKPRVPRTHDRGLVGFFRTPVDDSLSVFDGNLNSADLPYEVSALPRPDRPLPIDWDAEWAWMETYLWPAIWERTYWIDDLTDPQGMKLNPVAAFNLDNASSGWRERMHSDHLDRDLEGVFRWYELLFSENVIGPGEPAILPAGME